MQICQNEPPAHSVSPPFEAHEARLRVEDAHGKKFAGLSGEKFAMAVIRNTQGDGL